MSEVAAQRRTIETREIAIIERALKEHGSANRRELRRRWGHGVEVQDASAPPCARRWGRKR
jgi:hypothetical protein